MIEINMYDDIFDKSEARILIEDKIKGKKITLKEIRNKIIELEKENYQNELILNEKQIYINKIRNISECSSIKCDECGNQIFL